MTKTGKCIDCDTEIVLPFRGTRKRCEPCGKVHRKKQQDAYNAKGYEEHKTYLARHRRQAAIEESRIKRSHLGLFPEDQADEIL